MAGQYGNVNVTMQNIEVVDILEDDNLVLLKGSIPGQKGSVVKISDAIKRALPAEAPLPTFRADDKKVKN